MLYIFRFLLVVMSSFLYVINANAHEPINPAADTSALGEKCRRQAIQLDGLSRYQDRAICTLNLDGTKVYFASQYILAKQEAQAKPLIDEAITRIKFAIDIGCYGQDDMKHIIKDLQDVLSGI